AVRVANVGQHVRLTVSDDGAGIAPAALPRLFERFWQADTSITRTEGGLGLGLAVGRHLVELHGGAVAAESAGVGRGAPFSVMLPRLPVRSSLDHFARSVPVDERAAAPRTTVLLGVRVLVVDDDESTCEIVGEALEHAGAEVRTCLSASRA